MQTLVLTDIATGWTECAPLLVREQRLLTEVLGEIRKLLPFPLLGLDTDNDSAFMNETVPDYCEQVGIEFTRCRPHRKKDQAWVEQKNGAVVRRTIGCRRFKGLEAAASSARLYSAMRLFVNFFQPSFKFAAQARDGAQVRKRYHPPAIPCERLLADPRTTEEAQRRVKELRATLDPVPLLQQIRAAQQQLVDIADRPAVGEVAKRLALAAGIATKLGFRASETPDYPMSGLVTDSGTEGQGASPGALITRNQINLRNLIQIKGRSAEGRVQNSISRFQAQGVGSTS